MSQTVGSTFSYSSLQFPLFKEDESALSLNTEEVADCIQEIEKHYEDVIAPIYEKHRDFFSHVPSSPQDFSEHFGRMSQLHKASSLTEKKIISLFHQCVKGTLEESHYKEKASQIIHFTSKVEMEWQLEEKLHRAFEESPGISQKFFDLDQKDRKAVLSGLKELNEFIKELPQEKFNTILENGLDHYKEFLLSDKTVISSFNSEKLLQLYLILSLSKGTEEADAIIKRLNQLPTSSRTWESNSVDFKNQVFNLMDESLFNWRGLKEDWKDNLGGALKALETYESLLSQFKVEQLAKFQNNLPKCLGFYRNQPELFARLIQVNMRSSSYTRFYFEEIPELLVRLAEKIPPQQIHIREKLFDVPSYVIENLHPLLEWCSSELDGNDPAKAVQILSRAINLTKYNTNQLFLILNVPEEKRSVIWKEAFFCRSSEELKELYKRHGLEDPEKGEAGPAEVAKMAEEFLSQYPEARVNLERWLTALIERKNVGLPFQPFPNLESLMAALRPWDLEKVFELLELAKSEDATKRIIPFLALGSSAPAFIVTLINGLPRDPNYRFEEFLDRMIHLYQEAPELATLHLTTKNSFDFSHLHQVLLFREAALQYVEPKALDEYLLRHGNDVMSGYLEVPPEKLKLMIEIEQLIGFPLITPLKNFLTEFFEIYETNAQVREFFSKHPVEKHEFFFVARCLEKNPEKFLKLFSYSDGTSGELHTICVLVSQKLDQALEPLLNDPQATTLVKSLLKLFPLNRPLFDRMLKLYERGISPEALHHTTECYRLGIISQMDKLLNLLEKEPPDEVCKASLKMLTDGDIDPLPVVMKISQEEHQELLIRINSSQGKLDHLTRQMLKCLARGQGAFIAELLKSDTSSERTRRAFTLIEEGNFSIAEGVWRGSYEESEPSALPSPEKAFETELNRLSAVKGLDQPNELTIALALARTLIDASGRVNAALIPALRGSSTFQNLDLPTISKEHVNRVLELFEEDPELCFRCSLAAIPQPGGPSDRVLRRMMDLENDEPLQKEHACIAIVSGLLCPTRQGNIGSCYSTSLMIQMDSYSDGIRQKLEDLLMIIKTSSFTRTSYSQDQETVVQYPLFVEDLLDHKELGKDHLLNRVREFSLTTLGRQSANLAEENLRMLSTEVDICLSRMRPPRNALLYLNFSASKQLTINKQIVQSFKTSFNHCFEGAFSACRKHPPPSSDLGADLLLDAETGKPIATYEEYFKGVERALSLTKESCLKQFPDDKELIEQLFSQESGLFAWLNSSAIPMQADIDSDNPAWIKYGEGGHLTSILKGYFEMEQEVQKEMYEPHTAYNLQHLTSYIAALPKSIKAKVSAEPALHLPFSYPGHALSLLPHEILKRVHKGENAQEIQNTLELLGQAWIDLPLAAEERVEMIEKVKEAEPLFENLMLSLGEFKTLRELGEGLERQMIRFQYPPTVCTWIRQTIKTAIYTDSKLMEKAPPPLLFGDTNWEDLHDLYFACDPLTGKIEEIIANPGFTKIRFINNDDPLAKWGTYPEFAISNEFNLKMSS